MAWLRQGDGGLPRFQQQPPGLPFAPAPADNGRAGSGSLDGHGLAHAYSTDTQRSTEEEEELSREVRGRVGPVRGAAGRLQAAAAVVATSGARCMQMCCSRPHAHRPSALPACFAAAHHGADG